MHSLIRSALLASALALPATAHADPLTPEAAAPQAAGQPGAGKYQRQVSRDLAASQLAELKKAGMQVTELPAAEVAKLRDKMKPVIDKHSDSVGAAVVQEVQAELAEQAKARLTRLGKSQVKVLHRDASSSLKDLGLFDAVVLGGSVAEVPATLLSLLNPGGRLLAIVGDTPIMRVERHTCVTPGEYAVQSLWDIVAPRLHGFAEHPSFSF